MMYLVIAALVIAVPFVARAYFKLAARSAARAQGAWQSLEQNAHVLLEDRRLDPRVGDMIEFVVHNVGDGKLTRAMLASLLGRRKARTESGLATAIGALNDEQSDRLMHFLISALFYDSLRVPLRGGVLRRALYWLATSATDRSAPLSQAQVEPVARAAGSLCPSG